MNPWRPYPLLRILFPFLAGIISAIGWPELFQLPVSLYPLILVLCCFLVVLAKRKYSFGFRVLTGFFLVLFVILLGHGLTRNAITAMSKPVLKPPTGWYLLEISDPPLVRPASAKIIAEARYLHQNEKWIRVNGRYSLQLKMNFSKRPVFCGDYIYACVSWQEIPDNANPYAFNYANYLAGKGIYFQSWVDYTDWIKLDIKPSGFIRSLSFSIRERLLGLLRNNHLGGQEFAVSAALLLGYVDELDAGLKKAYSATGAMHILSVSGMHVGIIYLFITFLFGFLDRKPFLRACKTVLVLLLIWFYALLTGLSPSVLRAATMLSFLIAGKSLGRSPETINILSASMFFILVFNPLILRDIGFQLSYLAVAGICLLYKPVYDWVVTSLRIWDKIWSVLAVSIVAQLATFPLSLYYFHQFPNFFLLTNLAVVPLSSLIIYMGVLALILGAIPILSVILTKGLGWLVFLLNFIIQRIEALPFSTTRGIFITTYEMLVLYLLIVLISLFIMKKTARIIFLIIISLILLETSFLWRRMENSSRYRFTVYNIKKMTCFGFSGNNAAALFYDFGSRAYSPGKLENAMESISPVWSAWDIKTRTYFWLGSEKLNNYRDPFHSGWVKYAGFFQYRTNRIGLLKEKVPGTMKVKISLDYLIISCNPNIQMKDVVRVFQVKELIFDATNSSYRIGKWMEEAVRLGLKCHAVTRDGAFVREF